MTIKSLFECNNCGSKIEKATSLFCSAECRDAKRMQDMFDSLDVPRMEPERLAVNAQAFIDRGKGYLAASNYSSASSEFEYAGKYLFALCWVLNAGS